MRQIRLAMIMIAAASLVLPGFDGAYARGGGHMGGGHMGGGRAGGGWGGGRAGGGGERGGGEFHGGGERRGEGHGGEGHGGEGERHGDHGDHGRRHDNNNNDNNRTTNVNVYGGGGDWGWGWGAADGALAGLAVGTVVGEAAAQPTTVVVEQPSAPAAPQQASGAPAYGTQVTVLPAGSVSRNVHGTMAYQCGSVWYRPYFGSSSVYYEVVPPPPQEGEVPTTQDQ